MTIPQAQQPDMNEHLDFVVMAPPPNDNTDGRCACGHAKTDHGLLRQSDPSEPPSWRCRYCACERAYPATIPSSK